MRNFLYFSIFLFTMPVDAQSDYTLEGYATAGATVEVNSPDNGAGWSLTGTISQPITGQASVGEYTIDVGSWTFITRSNFIILSDSFEETTR